MSHPSKPASASAKAVGAVLDGLVRSLGIDAKLREYEAVTRWTEVVGEHVAHAAAATSITRGVLMVRVESSVWRNELLLRKKEIMEKLNAAIGADVVKDIKYH